METPCFTLQAGMGFRNEFLRIFLVQQKFINHELHIKVMFSIFHMKYQEMFTDPHVLTILAALQDLSIMNLS
jgi:hypothetical protein